MRLHRVECFAIEDRRDLVIDDLIVWILVSVLVEDIPGPGAGVGFANQHFVDGARVEFSAGAGAMTGCIQMPGDVADTHGPRRAGPRERELEDGANDVGLDGVDGELALRRSTDRVGVD
ncbi:MAG: hypothetical protein WC281_07605 [Bosea sp. (in: a-proteobacteria)]